MQVTPTTVINKTLSRMDPWYRVPTPSGGLYSTARAIRDLPISMGGFTPLAATVMGPGAWFGYAAAAGYATMREAIAAAPAAVAALERIGGGGREFTAPFVDTRAALSMRQASLRALHDSSYFLRSVLCREGKLMHR